MNGHLGSWVAGTGTDAAPYFRVFNPVLQGEKFDLDAERRDALARHQAARS
ncbi:MAG TPA: FAD-binding domain-containing protein [Propionibacteriaceae bacterium]